MDSHKEYRKAFSLLILVLTFFYIAQIMNISYYPAEIKIAKGENKSIDVLFPFSLNALHDEDTIVQSTYNQNNTKGFKKSYQINGIEAGEAKFQLKLLGLIPIKRFDVNVVKRQFLVPGGNALGVRLNTKGVLVVAVTDVLGVDGKRYNPAKEAGIKTGDSILEINDIKVKDAEHVVELLNQTQDKKIKIVIERNKIRFETEVIPVKSMQDNCYRLGIWVRDKTAGIGTLTFYDENSKIFGALGHGITDMDTGNLLNVEYGKITNAKIANIEQGKRGSPGEIRGIFYETENVLGEIIKNSPYGIFGVIGDEFIRSNKTKPIPIGFKEEVREGKAHILTTIDNNKIEKFEIEIIKAQPQQYPNQKSITVKIVDKRLLQKTGGIVQGMSGSPIIQDGKLIGAITHVFVNDPTKGYGIYIEWMLEQVMSNYQTNNKLVNNF
ncbi:Stage IV sporulation protein B [[Clostridium] ultunense Esp]|uniref:Stage IV sporulation protein B n=1 Tax=[Clostridium] ultunense Esp TaxID=1288971 RepID=M1ZDK9_9FIRM|nr:SpoIVB peptidase [Schnuerera ultunensis]CCQ96013.1 Stage IV sporulation protein B [[Clostridium] ultunense Esp]SHD77150.1 Stage IV sporulation protein B [[Clostridium] ultunense Esp]